MDKDQFLDMLRELADTIKETPEEKRERHEYYLRLVKVAGFVSVALAGVWLAQYALYTLFQFPFVPHCVAAGTVAQVCK